MIREIIRNSIKKAAAGLWPGIVVGEIIVEKPDDFTLGDYAVNTAFRLAREVKSSPSQIAEQIAQVLGKNKPEEIEKIQSAGGYVNFFISTEYLQDELARIYKERKSYGESNIGKGKKVIVEYSSPNIAKPMHVGHLRSTIIGDALANIYEISGYKVIRWNYLGDWGTQFGKLIAAYKLWGDKKEIEREPIRTLVGLYVRFHEESKTHPELEIRGQEEFSKFERGDKENRKLWERFKKESLKEFDKIYKTLGVKFDIEIGESVYEKDLAPTITDLQKKGLAERGEGLAHGSTAEGGSLIIKLDSYDLPPALVQKSDGASLYLTREIASLKSRISKYKPDKILYVVANQQALHFQQLFAIAEILGLDHTKLEHIKFGMVLGEGKKKISTREGAAITLEEVIERAVKMAREIVEKKNPALSQKEKERIAQVVAVGALKYQDLKEHRTSDIVFDWGRMLDFAGNSGPYLQYTYARLASILKKAGKTGRADFGQLTEDTELALVKHFIEFPQTIEDSCRVNLTNNLALYLYELANLANRFYESVPILKDDNVSRRSAHLVLIETATAVLKNGLNLLGIQVLEKI